MKSSGRRDTHFDVETVAQGPGSGRSPGSTPAGPVALLIAGHPEESGVYGVRLRQDGYSVLPASGLERGLDLAAVARPDLVFVCLGPWAVPALVLLALRTDPATRGVPTVLVSDLPRARLSTEVGGLLATENVVPRTSAVREERQERALSGRPGGCGRRPGWEQWLRPR
jgi:hypothetical protein